MSEKPDALDWFAMGGIAIALVMLALVGIAGLIRLVAWLSIGVTP